MSTRYTVQWHKASAAIDAGLWGRCFTPPAERLWWYAALESAGLDDQFAFFFGELRDASGTSIGIVPAFVMNVPMELVAPPAAMRVIRALGRIGRPFLTQRTLFIGNVAGEGGSVGLMPGIALADVVESIERCTQTLRRSCRAKLVVWKDFPLDASRELAAPLARAGYFRIPSYPATRLVVPPGGVDGYIASLDGDYRYKLRKKLRRSHASTALIAETLREPSAEILANVWRLFWATYERGHTKFERFTPAVFQRFAAHDGSRWVTLRVAETGAMVAFMLLTREGDHWVNRFIGLDYDAPAELFLYYRLFVEAIAFIATEPMPFLLSGQTGYRAKIELGHTLEPLTNFTRHRNPVMHRIYAAVARGIGWRTLDEELRTYLGAHPQADRGDDGLQRSSASSP